MLKHCVNVKHCKSYILPFLAHRCLGHGSETEDSPSIDYIVCDNVCA